MSRKIVKSIAMSLLVGTPLICWSYWRTQAVVTITPTVNPMLGAAGHKVEFRKAPTGFISGAGDSLASANSLFGLAVSDSNVIADATDSGVSVINYVDNGGGNVFPNPRDVGIPPLTAVKTTGPAGGVNSGTFNPLAEDDEFAMRASGFILIPQAGNWTFFVRSDDSERLTIGDCGACGAGCPIITIFDGARGAATDSTTVSVPSAGYYHYNLTWNQGNGGAMCEFFAQGPSQASPALVGDTTNGGLQVFQSDFTEVSVTPLAPEPNGTGAIAGHNIEFRKAPAGFISGTGASLASADALFGLALSDSNIIADGTDNGVAVINYLDTGGGNVFAIPRDVGIPPLTAVKTTGTPGGVNSGTFNPLAEDDEFAMRASGFMLIPQAGNWTFFVRSDDAERLTMGACDKLITIFDGVRAPATDSTTVNVPSAGYYHYNLTWNQGGGGSMCEFFAQGPGQASPALVGDTANGGLQVFQQFCHTPTITCPSNITAVAATNVCQPAPCAVVNFTTMVSSDCPANVMCSPASGSCFPIGSTSVTCTATDTTGNTASCSFSVTVFNVCLQDDSNPKIVLLINASTGAYRFCCAGVTFTGTGQISSLGCTLTLQHNSGDRRLLVKIDNSMFKGTATLQTPPGVVRCAITDRDTRNNVCTCQ